MKSKIKLSLYSLIITIVVTVGLLVGCILTVHDKSEFFTLLVLVVVLLVCGLFYGTSYIAADTDRVVMGSLLKKRAFPVCDIQSVELFQPTMGAIRILGSGGYYGYWGYFREGDIGRYYAFYGKASDCFLIRMKNGDKYVLGCEHPQAMVDFINSILKGRE